MLRTVTSALRSWNIVKSISTSTVRSHPRGKEVKKTEEAKVSNTIKPYSLARLQDQFVTYKPITPSIRHLKRPYNPHLFPGRPLEFLTTPQRKRGGRNTTHGRITVRFRGGGHRRRLRLVDFRRLNGDPHDVIRIEYDPGRSGHIALLKRKVQLKKGVVPSQEDLQPYSYILACDGLKAGDVVRSFRLGVPEDLVPGFREMMAGASTRTTISDSQITSKPPEAFSPFSTPSSSNINSPSTATLAIGMLRAATLKPGNVLPLHLIPTGTQIHNIALDPNGPGILVRSAGTEAVVTGHEENGKYTQVRLQSGEIRKILSICPATIGRVSNPYHKYRNLAKAGRRRWLGFRPRVRGMAMNAVDHPHGGGRAKSKGNKHPRSVWGWLTKGKRTRKPGPKGHPGGNKMVIKERPRGKDKLKLKQ